MNEFATRAGLTAALLLSSACDRNQADSGDSKAQSATPAPVLPPAVHTLAPALEPATKVTDEPKIVAQLADAPKDTLGYLKAVEAAGDLKNDASPVVECRGGEVKVGAHRYTSGADLVKVSLESSAAGHRSWSYDAYVRAGELVAARHRVRSWRFSGGTADKPDTQDTLLERLYEVLSGKVVHCIERRVEGPTGEIESLLEKDAGKECASSDGPRVSLIAQNLQAELSQKDLTQICENSDPSSGLKL